MKPLLLSSLFVSALVIEPTVQAASFTDPMDGAFDMGEVIAENPYAFMPIPVILTEPAIGYGARLCGLFLNESKEARTKRKKMALESPDGGAKLLPPNFTIAGAAGTQNGTWFAGIGHRHTWLDDRIRYFGGMPMLIWIFIKASMLLVLKKA
ncbi:hypothetical protein [Vibrio sp. S11_S32]|uniref:hypothetical protein n=1 Tax=Vibrio sp. S11_S32 TaxID=2720225 RepID=UPI0019316732|nr:hypothetical protein [Vibrio sp. S11_S32]